MLTSFHAYWFLWIGICLPTYIYILESSAEQKLACSSTHPYRIPFCKVWLAGEKEQVHSHMRVILKIDENLDIYGHYVTFWAFPFRGGILCDDHTIGLQSSGVAGDSGQICSEQSGAGIVDSGFTHFKIHQCMVIGVKYISYVFDGLRCCNTCTNTMHQYLH